MRQNPFMRSKSAVESFAAARNPNWLHALLTSPTFQLIGALLIGVPLPNIIRRAYEILPGPLISYDIAMTGSVTAIFVGYTIYRKVTSLPGTHALLNQLPGFAIAYLAVAAFFFALRLDFSRQEFVMSFLFVTSFFATLTFFSAKLRQTTYGYIGKNKEVLSELKNVSWVWLASPEDAERDPHMPLVADFRADLSPAWERYIAEVAISGRRVFNFKQLKESLAGKVEIDHISENSFGHLAPDKIYAHLKLYIDILTSIVALALLWPVMLIIAIIIKTESTGPAVFRQMRMGHRGKPFIAYKFRSMNNTGSGQKLQPRNQDITHANDQRITRFGRLIRKTRLDELPQLFNVMRGEMSWIGPRPETLHLSKWYETEIPFYRYRHIVRPGITGWAQVKQGHVTSVDDVREKLEYDFFYVRNFSLWLDILIVMQTLRVILTGRGAK